jgi:hypothetical protein
VKRSLPFIPIIFLALLNACSGFNSPTDVPGHIFTAAVQSMTATMWTPTPTPSLNPNIPTMVNWMNADLFTANPLEWTLDARYQVTDVTFPYKADKSTLVFRVDVHCECINGTECCMPERTFVVIVGSMKRNSNTILAQVPGGTNQMLVVCFKKKTPIGAMTASWQDVMAYLLGNLTGYQLGERASRAVYP